MEYNIEVVEYFRNSVCVRSEKEKDGFKTLKELNKSAEDVVNCVLDIVEDSTYEEQIIILAKGEISAKSLITNYFSGYDEDQIAEFYGISESVVTRGIERLKCIIRDGDLRLIAMRNVCNLHQAVTIKYLKYFKEHLPEGEDYASKYTLSLSKILYWCTVNKINFLGNISQMKENMERWVSKKESTGENSFLSVNYVMNVFKEEGLKRVVDLCRLVVEEFADYRRPHRSPNIHMWVGFGDYMYEELDIIIKGELV